MIRELFLEDLSLWSCVWQSTLFAVIGLLGSFLLRRRPARASQVLFLAMIAAVIVPAMSVLVKHFELGVFEAEPIALQPEVPNRAAVNDYGAFVAVPTTDIQHEVQEGLTDFEGSSGGASIPWRTIVLYGWMMATIILLGRLLVAFVSGVCLLRRAQSRGCEQIQRAADFARTRLGITKGLQVRSSKDVRSPVIWCWSPTPVLLVPSDLDDRIDWVGVICHELAHRRRWDHISGLIAELIVCILSWNPLMWWSKKRMVRLSEQACDDWVVAGGRPCEDYAQSLLDFKPQKQVAFVPAVVHSKKGLAGRVRRILNDSCGNPRAGVAWALAVSILAACLAVGAACAQTRPAKTESTTAREGKPAKSLHQAAADGDIEQVELRISEGAYINSKDPDGQTPLHLAAQHAQIRVAELLIAKGSDVNAKNRRAKTPLFEAMASSAASRKEVVELLVAKGAKIPAFHLAAYMGDIEKLKNYLQDGIDINSQEDFGSTALHLAANSGKKDIVEFLIGKGAQVDAKDIFDWTPLLYAASHNYEDIVDQLLAKGADVDAKKEEGFTLLYYAIWDENMDALKLLISKGANVNVQDLSGFTPLIYAIWQGDKEIVELLINRGANINVEDKYTGCTPLYWAAFSSGKDVFELLLAKGTYPSTIHLAACKGDLAKVKTFFEEGTDVNAKDKFGCTPLNWAVLAETNEVADFLIAKGADVNAKDNIGLAPLMVAHGVDILEFLISKGADVNVKMTGNGRTRLHTACFGGGKEIAELLISKGADVNVKDNWGNTPIHLAASKGHIDVVKLLLRNQADMNAKSNGGYTPLWKAKEKGHRETVELLRKHGAKE